jgi:hypothetical protein
MFNLDFYINLGLLMLALAAFAGLFITLASEKWKEAERQVDERIKSLNIEV